MALDREHYGPFHVAGWFLPNPSDYARALEIEQERAASYEARLRGWLLRRGLLPNRAGALAA